MRVAGIAALIRVGGPGLTGECGVEISAQFGKKFDGDSKTGIPGEGAPLQDTVFIHISHFFDFGINDGWQTVIDLDGFDLFFAAGEEVTAPQVFHIVKEEEPAGGEFKVVIAVRIARLDEELHAGVRTCLVTVLAGDGADVLILNAEEGIDKLIVIQYFQIGHGAVWIVLLPFLRAVPLAQQAFEEVILGVHAVGNGDGVCIFPLGVVLKIAIQCHRAGCSFYDETHVLFPDIYMDCC